MKNYNPSGDAFVQSMNKGQLRKRILIIVICTVVVVAIIAAVFVALHIKESNRIASAKSAMVQLDINSTFKTAEFADNDDWDNDGISNADEAKETTNPQNEDTDGDGISDGDEIKLGTVPTNPDTDGDGLLDGYEIIAGSNPREVSTDGKTKDADRVFDIKKTDGEITLTITGNANVADATIDELDLVGISSNTSVVSKAYDVYTDYKFDSANVSFKVDSGTLNKLGYALEDLSVLRFDVASTSYVKVDSKTDKASNTVSADISQLGTYVVGIDKTANEEATTRICFLIDNSGSMYPVEQCKTSSENDVDFKRLSFAQSLIDKFDKDFQIGICKFTGSYTKMVDFTSDRSALKTALGKIKSEEEIFNGTHSQTALKNCINEFANGSDGKYRSIIVMLTDGESDEDNPESVSKLAELAKDKNVVILTVGLGRDIDRDWLQLLASSTDGKYYSASDANALDAVYKQIVTTLNYDIVSYSEADDVSGYSLYNTGFEPGRNGFSFKNFRTTNTASVDFGMAVMARDWYLGNLQTKLGDISPADSSEQKVNSAGYDLRGTDFGKLYDERKELSAVNGDLFSGSYTDVREYLDYEKKGGTLDLKNEYKVNAEDKGWKITKTHIEAGNLAWQNVNLLSLDIADGIDKISKSYSENEAMFAQALFRLNALQWDDSSYEFNLTDGEEGFDELTRLLSLGVPVVTTIDDTHSVNTIGLIQDSTCHRKYILQVYDNNYPSTIKEIYLEKKPICNLSIADNATAKVDGTAFTYSATYEGKKVGIEFSNVEEH